jgi:hypothetical protein
MGVGDAMRTVLQNPTALAFFSFVIGVGIAVLLFHRPQAQRVLSSIPPKELDRTIVSKNGKCFRFRIEDASCPASAASAAAAAAASS